MDTEKLTLLLKQVQEIILAAGQFLKTESAHVVHSKEGHANFVTDMDVAVQERLIRDLRQILPEASIVAEEQDAADMAEYSWVIDPIDGTTNFICDYHFSCISIALVHGQESILGVVYNPYLDEMFYAAQGQGAFVNQHRIHASERPVEKGLVAMGTSPYHTELKAPTFAAAESLFSTCADIRRSGSAALDLCYVACGRLDGFFEYILSPWDYAAGTCIVNEAGGMVSGIDEDWSFSHPIGICASSRNLRDTIYRTICEKKKALL